MTILTKILKEKKDEVALLKQLPLPDVCGKNNIPKIKDTFPVSERLNIIAEIKRASPSKGVLNLAIDPAEQAKQYEQYGAGAISVLTDKTFFKGSMQDLRIVRETVDLPILCKDFIIDPVQIDHAKANGATIILLIAAALSAEQFAELYQYATAQGLEVLCEVHEEKELAVVLQENAPIIGINNRDLRDFHVDLGTTGRIVPAIHNKAAVIISESGIKTKADAETAANYGANTILVGEALVRSNHLSRTFADLQTSLQMEGNQHAR